jgi:hypothetical protein
MSPYEHPVTRDMRPPETKRDKKLKKFKGRSRFGHGAYTAQELCAVINSLIAEDLEYYIRANSKVCAKLQPIV